MWSALLRRETKEASSEEHKIVQTNKMLERTLINTPEGLNFARRPSVTSWCLLWTRWLFGMASDQLLTFFALLEEPVFLRGLDQNSTSFRGARRIIA